MRDQEVQLSFKSSRPWERQGEFNSVGFQSPSLTNITFLAKANFSHEVTDSSLSL